MYSSPQCRGLAPLTGSITNPCKRRMRFSCGISSRSDFVKKFIEQFPSSKAQWSYLQDVFWGESGGQFPGDYWRESYQNLSQIIQNKSLWTVSTYRIAGYKTATKFVRNLCTARNTWIIWTKSVSRVHFITLNQSPRLEWEWFHRFKKVRKHWTF